ncbi:DEAD/DEAH box helicase [Adhaeribacter sp. BT258]|uniref:RNA helicase n=1 Tax=Adhaeribacter terrigena TaxID=2793070 RepID=A0ABS1C135_9BACT|nr:DEAD/DEAH box helicase [Adhaeribacter terrigena]MBK0403122.1 DEAD/DEAH box helicase [Adhaeribacter terrigena]
MNKIKFEELPLSAEMQRAIADMGFEEASPIQTEAIPVIMEGRDVIGQAQTGTGKTAAFAIPAIEGIDENDRNVQVLILCPTRELAIQVSEEVVKLIKYKRNISVVPIFGGQSYDRQLKALRSGVQIVIGTPGRVMDHIERGTLKLDGIKKIILDEADEMLDMGFREDIEFVLTKVPESRQTILFSATMSKPIMEITKKFQKNPHIVKVTHTELTVTNIEQVYFEVRNNMKMEVLTRLLDMYNVKIGIIFCNTKRMVDELVSNLQARGYFADALHGDLNQTQRSNVMAKFKSGTLELLVATDVAARGIDVENVEAVFNYDLPQDEEAYVHRIGRTGRAGKSGKAFSFVSGRDVYKLKDIMRYTKAKILQQPVPSSEDVSEIRTTLFLEQIKEVIAKGNLDKAVAKVERLLAQDFTSLEVAAALLKMTMRESKAKEKSAEVSKGIEGPKPGMERIFVTMGKKDRVHPKDIIEAITEHTSIPANKIGDIDLYDRFSFVEIPLAFAQEVLDQMGRVSINDIPVTFQKAQKKDASAANSERSERREFGDGGGRGERREGGRSGGGGFRDRDRGDRDGGGFRGRDGGDRGGRGGDRERSSGGGGNWRDEMKKGGGRFSGGGKKKSW